jgi:hypothetical protein
LNGRILKIMKLETDKYFFKQYITSIIQQIPDVCQVSIVARAINDSVEGNPQEYSRSMTPIMTPLLEPFIAEEISEFFRRTVLPTVPKATAIRFQLAVRHPDESIYCNSHTIITR